LLSNEQKFIIEDAQAFKQSQSAWSHIQQYELSKSRQPFVSMKQFSEALQSKSSVIVLPFCRTVNESRTPVEVPIPTHGEFTVTGQEAGWSQGPTYQHSSPVQEKT